MQLQLNTDKHIQGTENLKASVADKLEKTLKHLTDHITRIEVHLSDQNGDKGGADDILCKIEARLKGKQPVLVQSKSDDKDKAVTEAAEKLKAAMNSIIGKMRNN